MTLPTDVAIRTTSHQGSRIKILYELWSDWIHAIPSNGAIAGGMLESADDFMAALFNLVHGFYKQCIASLRSALETMVIASECTINAADERWTAWQGGDEIRFADSCKQFVAVPEIAAIEQSMREQYFASLLPNVADPSLGQVWTRNLYGRLSQFSHARGDSTNGGIWQSNGPIYSEEGMRLAYHSYIETFALSAILAALASKALVFRSGVGRIFLADNIGQFVAHPFAELCVAYSAKTIRVLDDKPKGHCPSRERA